MQSYEKLSRMLLLKDLGVIPIDNNILESVFKDHKHINSKLVSLEKKGDLIRLKRGLYVVSPKLSNRVLSTELIANHLYGPSYISMESALRFYGLIPDEVFMVRSMTTKRSRHFANDIAHFQFIQCNADYYAIGIDQFYHNGYSFLIASPEKALCDMILYTQKLRPRFIKDLQVWLEEDLRLEMDAFFQMNTDIFKDCAKYGKKKNELLNLIKIRNK